MPIHIRFYTAVVKKSAIRAHYPGGLSRFIEDRPAGIPQDHLLVGVPFMSGGALQQFLDVLTALGFALSQSCAVAEMKLGVLDACPGIHFVEGNETGVFGPGWIAYAS